MGRSADYSREKCAIAGALALVGEPWTLLIIRDAFRGFSRFEQWQKSLGIARNVLAARLRTLVSLGILQAIPYQQKPLRHEYVLTPQGHELKDLLLALYEWGRTHVYCDQLPALVLRDRTTGEEIRPRMHDAATGREIRLQDMRFSINPEAATLAELQADTSD